MSLSRVCACNTSSPIYVSIIYHIYLKHTNAHAHTHTLYFEPIYVPDLECLREQGGGDDLFGRGMSLFGLALPRKDL